MANDPVNGKLSRNSGIIMKKMFAVRISVF